MTACPPPNTPVRPWETLNGVMFDRFVDVHRTIPQEAQFKEIGNVGYSGMESTTTPGVGVEGEQVLYVGVPATIVPKAPGRGKGPLPADVVYKPVWTISIPGNAVPQHAIRDRDLIIDDEGYRYSVGAAGWSPMAWSLDCIRLEA